MEKRLVHKVENRVLDLLSLLTDLGLDIEIPKIKFDIEGRAAGQCRCCCGTVCNCVLRFNSEFLRKHEEDFIRYTVAHEVAHYAVFVLYDRTQIRPHGKEWQMIMRVFGIKNPRRCHDYDSGMANPRYPWVYRCKCQDHFLSTCRHNKVKRGTVYGCDICKEVLRFIGRGVI
jgi:SprT protein